LQLKLTGSSPEFKPCVWRIKVFGETYSLSVENFYKFMLIKQLQSLDELDVLNSLIRKKTNESISLYRY
jgi:hypothetical protein